MYLTASSPILEKDFTDLIHKEDLKDDLNLIEELIKGNIPGFEHEERLIFQKKPFVLNKEVNTIFVKTLIRLGFIKNESDFNYS